MKPVLNGTEYYNQDLQKIIILSEQQKKEIRNSQKEYLERSYFDTNSVNEEMEKMVARRIVYTGKF